MQVYRLRLLVSLPLHTHPHKIFTTHTHMLPVIKGLILHSSSQQFSQHSSRPASSRPLMCNPQYTHLGPSVPWAALPAPACPAWLRAAWPACRHPHRPPQSASRHPWLPDVCELLLGCWCAGSAGCRPPPAAARPDTCPGWRGTPATPAVTGVRGTEAD